MSNDNTQDIPKKEQSATARIGTEIDLTLVGFNGDQPIRSKVDTGADSCSLHATNIQIGKDPYSSEDGQVVAFNYNERQYRMAISGYQAISSADGGTTNRPIVSFSVRAGEQLIEDVQFNLNDRSHMEFPILIGLNLLEQMDIVIDPTISEMELEFKASADPDQVGEPTDQLILKNDKEDVADPKPSLVEAVVDILQQYPEEQIVINVSQVLSFLQNLTTGNTNNDKKADAD